MAVFKDCHQRLPKVSAEVMACLWWCFLWWCSCGGVFVVVFFCGGVGFCGGVVCVFVVVWCFCGGGVVFCGGVVVFLWWCGVFVVLFLWWCGGEDRHQRLPKVLAEVMAVLKDCHQRLPKVLCGGVCGGVCVVVFLWWCLVWCFLWWCGGVLVVVFLWWCFLRWCFCGGVPKVLLKSWLS